MAGAWLAPSPIKEQAEHVQLLLGCQAFSFYYAALC